MAAAPVKAAPPHRRRLVRSADPADLTRPAVDNHAVQQQRSTGTAVLSNCKPVWIG